MAEERQRCAVVPSGIIAAEASRKGITYEWFDCHPPSTPEPD
jgi:hypothetical protein